MVYAPHEWAYSSAGEHYIDIVGVTGSIPVTPTIRFAEIVDFIDVLLLYETLVFGVISD
jgi:hypothetical protein